MNNITPNSSPKEQQVLIILTPGFPKDEADTTCLPMQQSFIRTLKETWPQINIIILSFQYPYHKKKYKWFGTTVISFNGQNKGGLKRMFLRRKLNTTLKEIKNENNMLGILSFWYGECALAGKRFADKNNIKHYCWIFGQDAKKENKYPKRVPASARELIALSDFLQDEFETNHNIRPGYVIPPGIDLQQFSNGTKEKNIDILGAGSMIPLKRYDTFLEVVAEIKKELPGIKAVLAGNGPEKEKLQALVLKYGLQENVTLPGELAHDEVLRLMQHTKLLLHPSSYEGFSGVCLEALSGGAHVISFCRPMKQEIQNWHIVIDKSAMIKKALVILQDPRTIYNSVSFTPMKTTAKKIMELFTG